MGWLIALGVLAFLALLPLGVRVKYDADGAAGWALLGPVRIRLFPRPKKEKKQKKERRGKQAQPERENPEQPSRPAQRTPEQLHPAQPARNGKPKESGGRLTDFLPLVRLGLDFLGDFRRKLRVNRLELKLVMAAEDPYDLAVNYGRAWAAVGNLMPRLEKIFVIQKRNIEVECDFTAEDTRVIARLDLTITLGRLVSLAAVYAVRAIKEYLKFRNKRKGGAVNEQKSS